MSELIAQTIRVGYNMFNNRKGNGGTGVISTMYRLTSTVTGGLQWHR